ncbi:MAG: hypothetical protein M1546_21110 [Chloroflexi bacterium]|nr:hypothetical protein [Chloroflexota bacterium]
MLSAAHNLRLGNTLVKVLTPGQLIALADSLRTAGVLNEQQLDTLAALRAGLVRLTSP